MHDAAMPRDTAAALERAIYSPDDVDMAVETLCDDLWILQCVAEAVCPPDPRARLTPPDRSPAGCMAQQRAVDAAALHRAVEVLTDSVNRVVQATARDRGRSAPS